MGFQQAAELEQGGGIRGGLPGQVYANEAADGFANVDGIFDAFIGQTKALLRNVNAQHTLYANRWLATAGALGVVWFDLGDQSKPWRDGVKLTQKPATAGDFLLGSIFQLE